MDDTKTDLELECIEGWKDTIAPQLAANHNETLVVDFED